MEDHSIAAPTPESTRSSHASQAADGGFDDDLDIFALPAASVPKASVRHHDFTMLFFSCREECTQLLDLV